MSTDNTEFIKGTCLTMCPTREIKQRERHRLLHKFEMITGTETFKRPRVDKTKVVKEYRRPAAGKQEADPSDLRPGSVLLQCTHYLLDTICGQTHTDWIKLYEFVFDRLRAVRQDMVIQNLSDNFAISVLECCVRFHVYSSYVLRHIRAGSSEYDDKINTTHAQECLKRLLCLYSVDNNCRCNKAEFLALYLLFNVESIQALQLAEEHNSYCEDSADFQTALVISSAWLNKNYVRVFKNVEKLPPLLLCALGRHLPAIRLQALKAMSVAYSGKNLSYSLGDLTNVLALDSEEQSRWLCEECGLEVKDGRSVLFSKSTFNATGSGQWRGQSDWIDRRLEKVQVSGLLKGEQCICSTS